MALSRREFIKRGLVAAGAATAALGGFGFVRNLFAEGAPGNRLPTALRTAGS